MSIETIYVISGLFTCTAGMTMMIIYSLNHPWWRSQIGRMLITLAAAETGMSAIFWTAAAFQYDVVYFRYVWVILQVVVGLMLYYQSWVILRLRKQRKELV